MIKNFLRSPAIDPVIRDVWSVVKVIRVSAGLVLGLFLYTYGVFLFDHFGGDQKAFRLTIFLVIFTDLIIFLTEVPTGALADYIGRKKAVIASFSFQALTCAAQAGMVFIVSVKGSFILAALSAITYALSFTLFSGSFNAWVVDAVRERKIPEGHASLLARSYSYIFLGQIVGAIIGLSLYLSGYIVYAFSLGCTVCVVCVCYCGFNMQETVSLSFYNGSLLMKQSLLKMRDIMIVGFKILIKSPVLLYLVFIQTGLMFLINIVNYMWPIGMKTNFGAGKMSPYWFLIVFVGLGASTVGSKWIERINRSFQLNPVKKSPSSILWLWFVGVALVSSLPIAVLGVEKIYGFTSFTLFFVAITLCQFGYGFLSPTYYILLNNYIPAEHSKERATIMSFGSMFTSLVMMVLMFPSSGPNGEDTAIGWIIPSGIVILMVLIFHPLMRRYQRKIGELSKQPDAIWAENTTN